MEQSTATTWRWHIVIVDYFHFTKAIFRDTLALFQTVRADFHAFIHQFDVLLTIEAAAAFRRIL